MTIETFIQGLIPIAIPDPTMSVILYGRSIQSGADLDTVSERLRSLAYADACLYVSKVPSSYTGTKDSDNGWSHSEASTQMSPSDKSWYRTEANRIYIAYNDPAYRPGMKIFNITGKPYIQ